MIELLIVDDEPEIRNGLVRHIPWHQLGYSVVAALANGQEAINFVNSQKVDVILCDIKMPYVDGVKLARYVQENHPHIKVVFLSGYRDFEYARSALRYGVEEYLLKPTRPQQLKQAFAELREKINPRTPQNDTEPNPAQGRSERIVAAVNEFVEENIAEVTLMAAADHVGLNANYLSTLFKAQTGVTFAEYVHGRRMARATQLLDVVHLRTYEVAASVGYSDPKNFSRAFRDYFGCSPREYRYRGRQKA